MHLEIPEIKISSEEIADRIILPDTLESVVLILGPCRTGTTSLLRALAEQTRFDDSTLSVYQPMKTQIRGILANEETVFKPAKHTKKLIIKETLGPFVDQEMEFNPFDVLAKLNIGDDRLRVIFVNRHPFAAWISWKQCWGNDRVSIEMFIKAYKHYMKLYNEHSEGAQTYTYEMLEGNNIEQIIETLCKFTKIKFDNKKAHNWGRTMPSSEVIYWPKEPERFLGPRTHRTLNERTELEFEPKKDELNDKERELIIEAGLVDIYSNNKRKSEDDFRLQISSRVFETIEQE